MPTGGSSNSLQTRGTPTLQKHTICSTLLWASSLEWDSYPTAPTSSRTVTFKRINNSNATDSTVLQTVRIRGNNTLYSIVNLVENPVTFPDYTNRYIVQVKARGSNSGPTYCFSSSLRRRNWSPNNKLGVW